MASVRPCSFFQRRMVELAHGGMDFDVATPTWLVQGPLNMPRLKRAVELLQGRHEVLRTGLQRVDGEIVQQVEQGTDCRLELTEAEASGGDDDLSCAVDREAQRPIDLHDPPLWTLRVLRRDKDEHVLIWRMSHAIWDGYSASVLIRDLCALYRDPQPPPPLRLQFGDIACQERNTVPTPEAAAYWSEVLHAVGWRPSLGGAGRYSGRLQRWPALQAADLEAMASLARGERATTVMVLLGLLSLVMEADRPEGLVLGVFDANRGQTGRESVLGCVVNLLLLPSTQPPQRTLRAAVARARDALFGAYDHKLPFEAQLGIANGHLPAVEATVADAILNLHGSTVPKDIKVDDELTVHPLPVLPERRVTARGHWAASPLVINAAPATTGEMDLWCAFDELTFDRDHLRQMGSALVAMARQALAQPDRPLGTIEFEPR